MIQKPDPLNLIVLLVDVVDVVDGIWKLPRQAVYSLESC